MARNLPTIVPPEQHIHPNSPTRAWLGALPPGERNDLFHTNVWLDKMALAKVGDIVARYIDRFPGGVSHFIRQFVEEGIWAYEDDDANASTPSRVRRRRLEAIERKRRENDFAAFVAEYEVQLSVYTEEGIWEGVRGVLRELDKEIDLADKYWRSFERRAMYHNKAVQRAILDGSAAEPEAFSSWVEQLEWFTRV